ncbi:MAG: hypothetical protein P4M11_04265 [Candidatus Pacebacteria bacterium]|nr:hypothetical protein [Candidatus Paceibacterota bacterium]
MRKDVIEKPIKILVAEDEVFQRLALIDLIVNLCNYEVDAVENGQLALNLLQKYPEEYDLILLDVFMPLMVPFVQRDW